MSAKKRAERFDETKICGDCPQSIPLGGGAAMVACLPLLEYFPAERFGGCEHASAPMRVVEPERVSIGMEIYPPSCPLCGRRMTVIAVRAGAARRIVKLAGCEYCGITSNELRDRQAF